MESLLHVFDVLFKFIYENIEYLVLFVVVLMFFAVNMYTSSSK